MDEREVVEQQAENTPPTQAPTSGDKAEGSTQDAAAAPGAQQEEPKPERNFSQTDLDRILARERAKAERKAERYGYERAMREAAERQLQERQPPEPEASPRGEGRPTPNQFETYDQYVEALSDWKVEQRLLEVGRMSQEARTRAEAARQAEEVRSKLAPAAEKYEDFEDVVLRDDLPITRDMAEAILELGGTGHDVAYYLGTHPKEADRISKLGRIAQLKEIDKIATTLASPPEPTKVPPPIKPNEGSGAVEVRLEEADYDDFVKIRRRQIAARRG